MSVDKFSRTKFFNKNLLNGIKENDLPFNGFDPKYFKRAKTTYMIKADDVQRPDLISYKVYGRVNYWWIIMKINKIEDVWNDLVPGRQLQIPNVNDIDEYLKRASRKL